jgi:hypothetical protein
VTARIRAASLGSSPNGIPAGTRYVYRGTKTDEDVVRAPSGAARAASAEKAARYERFCQLRNAGRSVAEAAAEVGVGPAAAGRYERARLDALQGGEG